jgi:uncharacterized membrane protein
VEAKRSSFDWLLEGISLAGLVAVFAIVIFHWEDLPERIPAHFGASGRPNRWGAKSELWILPITSLILYVTLTAASRYQKLINVPFTIDRNAPAVRQILLSMSIALKAVAQVAFVYMIWMSVNTALGRANGLGILFAPVFLLATSAPIVFYLLKLRRYRKS